MAFLSSIFGTGNVIEKGFDLIDKLHTSDEEEIKAKAQAKVDLLSAYAPFKLAQRYIAFGFVLIFLFIMMNGVLGALYGVVDLANVKEAINFANDLWLGEIVLTIVAFYFGGGLANSIKGNK